MANTIPKQLERLLGAKKLEARVPPVIAQAEELFEFRDEIDKLPEAVRIKYSAELKALVDYTDNIDIQGGEMMQGSLAFPLYLPAEAFRGYLIYLRATSETSGSSARFSSKNANTESLLNFIVAMSSLSNGHRNNLTITADGITQEPGLSRLEEQIVKRASLAEDYPLFLKLAVDGGPEFSRLASTLLLILKTRNLNAQLTEMNSREAAIYESQAGLYESKEWDAMRLIPLISDSANQLDPSRIFWNVANNIFEECSKGLKPKEAYQKNRNTIVRELVTSYLCKYNSTEKVKDSDIEELEAICFWLVQTSRYSGGDGDRKKVEEESKLLRDSLFAYLGEVIGPKFLQKTSKTMTTDSNERARLLGFEDAEYMMGELDTCFKIVRSTDMPDFVDEKFLVKRRAMITEGYGLRKILEGKALQDIGRAINLGKEENGKSAKKASFDAVIRDFAILNLGIDGAKCPEDMFSMLQFLILIKNVKVADKVYEKGLNKFWQFPGAMALVLRKLTIDVGKSGDGIDIAAVVTMWSPAFLKKNPNLLKDLIKELMLGDYRTFENARLLTGMLIRSEKGWGEVAKTLAKSLFTNRADCFDANRVTVLRNIMQSLDVEERAIFFKKGFAENPFFVRVSPEERAKLARMLDMEVGGQDVVEQLAGGQAADFGNLQIEGELAERNFKELIDYIIANRSLALSGDGKMLLINDDDSPLAANFSEIRFSLNKEGRKNPSSLACNISLKLKIGGTWYFSIDADNNLLWRAAREGKLVPISLEQLMAELPQTLGYNGETNQEILAEINYLILKKLEELYVRKAAPAKGIVTEVQLPIGEIKAANESKPENDIKAAESTPPDSGPIMTEGMSQGIVRQEKAGVIDLADQFAQAIKMVHEDLQNGSEGDRELARQLRMKIGNNRELALQIFGKALARNFRDLNGGTDGIALGLALPVLKPATLSDLIVYRMITLEGEKYFEEADALKVYEELRAGIISSREIFVRSGSAHSQALPYLKVELGGELSEGEVERSNIFWKGQLPDASQRERRLVKEGVWQAKAHDDKMALRMEMFASSRENKNINLNAKEKVLYFDVDESPLHGELFERMKGMSAEEIRAEVGFPLRRELRGKLLEAKMRLVNPELNGAEYIAGLDSYESVKKQLENECEASIVTEVKKQLEIQQWFAKVTLKTEGAEESVKLRLPAIFKFNQTFNQGRFQSLAKLFESLDPEARKKYDVEEVA